jgi:hypothetical protein
MSLKTEYDFSLPSGYLDSDGRLHRQGKMRLATARDEIESLGDPRIAENEAYLPVILLSRVITQLGELERVTPQVLAGLFASDLAYLEDLYLRLNSSDKVILATICPHCSTQFRLQVAPLE